MKQTNKVKILIVEDEEAMREVLNKKLSSEGFDVVEAQDGEEGLATALKARPDLILLDIVMPKMDGMTMLKKLREDKWGKDAAVIILTNLTDAGKDNEVMKQGSYDFLVKTDWSINDVVSKVREKLK